VTAPETPADKPAATATAMTTTGAAAGAAAGAGGQLPVEPLDPVILAEVLETLAGRLEGLEALVQTLASRALASPAGGPWTWQHLSPAQTRELLSRLREWVDWLAARYDLRGEAHGIPPCWYHHPVAVEELTALMVAWQGAYSAKETQPSDALVSWHDRWLWPTLHRLNMQLRVWARCTGGNHTPPPGRAALTDGKAFERFLDEPGAELGSAGVPGCARTTAALDREQVAALLVAGEAIALLPDDRDTPIRCHGRWHAIEDGQPDEHWLPVDEERQAQLEQLFARLGEVSRPGGGR